MSQIGRFAAGLALILVIGLPPGVTQSAAAREAKVSAAAERKADRKLWFRDDAPTAATQRLLDYLSSAQLDGLDPAHYDLDDLHAAVATAASSGKRRDIERASALLGKALVAYVRDLHEASDVGMDYVDKELMPNAPPSKLVIRYARSTGSIDTALMMHPLYLQLRAGYAAWLQKWGGQAETTIASGPVLKLKSKGDRVRQLRERLALPEGTKYNQDVAAAVKTFQETHDLKPTGSVDRATLKMLNEGRQDQEARIRLNLERARLLPGWGGQHVVVDAAGQRLLMYDQNQLVDSMKVVVGKPSEPTPMMAALVRYAAVNPYWWVPPDLAAKRIAPNVLSGGMAYLNAKGYQVLANWSENAEPVDPRKVNWRAAARGRIELPMRQLPGPANMMGAMKFMFPNKYGVYLHDTPDKGLFGENDRRRSSGCVRLEDAGKLAEWLFGEVPTAPADQAEVHVPLTRPVPVYITYLTAASDGTDIAFRADVYGRDKEAATQLAAVE